MEFRDFCYWLRGYVEISAKYNGRPGDKEWSVIVEHLNKCFNKEPVLLQDVQPYKPEVLWRTLKNTPAGSC